MESCKKVNNYYTPILKELEDNNSFFDWDSTNIADALHKIEL